MRVMFPLMNLIITKWLLVYVLENKHNFYVIHFLSLTVWDKKGSLHVHMYHKGPKFGDEWLNYGHFSPERFGVENHRGQKEILWR